MAIKVAIVGVGPRGNDWIKEVRSSKAFELSAVVDVDQAVLARTAETYQLARTSCYDNLEEALIANKDCQAVVVTTPATQHFNDCRTALTHSKAVLVEKPFTTSLAEAVELVSLAEKKGLPLIVAQNYRYLRVNRAVRELIQNGKLGRIGMVVAQYYRGDHHMSPALKGATQSVLWGIGVHHFDAMRYLLDSEVTNVMCDDFTQRWTNLPKGASLRAMLSFENGVEALYTATYESTGHDFFERGQEFYSRFVGELATLHVFQRWLVFYEKGKLPRVIRRGKRATTEEQILLTQFERAITLGEQPGTTGKDNLQTMAVIEACLRSSADKKWINPQELLNELP